MIDASGFAASGQSRVGARPSDAVPTWDEVRTLIRRAWATFSSDDSGLPDNAGGTGDASIGSDIGSVAALVPVGDLLGEDVDSTPARHLPSVPGRAGITQPPDPPPLQSPSPAHGTVASAA
jgi:hypothetical protein